VSRMWLSLDSLRNMPKWVSRKDGAPSRHQNEQGELPGKAAYEQLPAEPSPNQEETCEERILT